MAVCPTHHQVIVRVARKVEPSRQKYIFPLPDLDGQGGRHHHCTHRPPPALLRAWMALVSSGRQNWCSFDDPWHHGVVCVLPPLSGVGDTPVSLFDKCLRARKLHTAILYLPLIESHYAITVLPPLGASR